MEAALQIEEKDNTSQGQENQQSPPSNLASESPMEVVAPSSRRASLDPLPSLMPMNARAANPPRGHPASPSQQPRGHPAITLRPLRPTLANTSAVGALLSPSQLLRLAQSPQAGAQHPNLRYVLDPETGPQLYAPQGSHLSNNTDDGSDRPANGGAPQQVLVLRAVKYLQERPDNQQTAPAAVQPQPQQQQQPQPQQAPQQQQQPAAAQQNGQRERQSSDVTGTTGQHAPSGSASGGQETTYSLARLLQQEQQQQQQQQQQQRQQQQQQWQLAQEQQQQQQQQRSISLQQQQQQQQQSQPQQSAQTVAAESLARPTAAGTTATGTSGEAAETQEPIDDDEVAGAPAAPGSEAAALPPGPVEVTVAVRVGAGGGRRPRGGVNRLATDIVRNGYTRGPVSGVFDLQRYKTGRDCIFYGNRWMSRSHFEKVGGSKMAKWYRSIRVLPELEMLGDWLERHGLTVTRGPSRRSSKRPAESDERVLGPSIEQVDSADVEGSSAGGEATTAALPLAQQLLLQRQGSIPSSERRFLQRLLNTLPLQMSPHSQPQHLDAMSGDGGEGTGRLPRDLYGPQSRLAWSAHPLAGAGYLHEAPRLPDAESARGDDASPDSGGAEMLSPRWRQQPPARRQCIRDIRDMPMTPPVQLPLQWAGAAQMDPQGPAMQRHRSGQMPGRQQDLDHDGHDVDAGEELDLSAPHGHHAGAANQPLPPPHVLQSLPPPLPRLRRVPYPGLDGDAASQGLGTTSSSRTTAYPLSDGQPPVLVLRRPNAMGGISQDERGGEDRRQNGMDGYGHGPASAGAVNGDGLGGGRWQTQTRKRQFSAVDESEWPEEPRRQPMYDQPRQVAVPVQMRRFMAPDDQRRGGEDTDEYPPRLMLVRRPAPLQPPSQQQQPHGWDVEEAPDEDGWCAEQRPAQGSSRGPKAARLSGPHGNGSPASQVPSWFAYGSAGSRDVGSRRWAERPSADMPNEAGADHHE